MLAVGAAYGLDAPIATNVASLFVGEPKIVEGKVLKSERDASTVRLHFGPGPRDFTVSLVIPLLNTFPPDPERAYLGKTVRVVGVISDFRGAPEMIIRDAADIQVVGEAAPAVVPAANTAPAATAPNGTQALHEQIEELTERLRAMEDRLRALEGTDHNGATGK